MLASTQRFLVTLAVVGLMSASCADQSPSYTRVMCDRLMTAHAARDADRVERVIETMLDIGTEENPQAVEPRVYVHVLLLTQAIRDESQVTFDAEMDALLAECAKAEG